MTVFTYSNRAINYIYNNLVMFILFRAKLNNSVKLMVVGMHGKGKTTLLSCLEAEGRFKESFYTSARKLPSPPPDDSGNTVGIKIGTWSYCINRSNPTLEFPELEFYTWDYAGEVNDSILSVIITMSYGMFTI